MIAEELREENSPRVDTELTVLLGRLSDGRRIQDVRVFLKSIKETMCLRLPLAFESQEELSIL